MFGIGMQELLVILIVGMLIFGSSKLPEIGRQLGKAIREFKKTAKEIEKEPEQPEKKNQENEKKV